jgi:cell wall-associated NlpC family hydrolase
MTYGSIAIPDITEMVTPLLGDSYEKWDCWNLVRHLYLQAFGFDLARKTDASAQRFQEVWYRGDGELLHVVQPWDLALFTNSDEWPVGEHVGIIVDQQTFVHARRSETGVALGRLRSWKARLIQVARLRELV